MKSNLDKLREEYTDLDTMFSKRDIECLQETCEAILKDIVKLEAMVLEEEGSDSYMGGFLRCMSEIKQLLKGEGK